MTRRVRRRGGEQSKGKEKVMALPSQPENFERREIPPPDDGAGGEEGGGGGGGGREVVEEVAYVDWTSLTDDAAIQLLSCLNYRDRASLASTCRAWRSLASAPCLWTSLDLRAHGCGIDMAAALAGRCADLRDLRFRGTETAGAVMFLQARGLRGIVGDYCRDISDTTLAVIASRHEALESLQIGQSLERITSDGVRHVAMCCTRLKRMRLLGVREVGGEAINALAKHCPVLEEIAFMDCGFVDEGALGNVSSLRFLSVAGSKKMRWGIASFAWSNLQNLLGVDVSRTDATPSFVSRLMVQTKSLRVISALNCQALEEELSHNPLAFGSTKGKLLLTLFSDMCKGISSLFAVPVVKELEIFDEWKSWPNKDIKLNGLMSWLEWILSHALLRIAEIVPRRMNEFWLKKGAALLLGLIRSSQEDVQERAATGLATFVVVDDENATVDPLMAETVLRHGGIPLLLELARSPREGIQSEAAKAIANLSVNSKVAKAVADAGGISILAGLAGSMNRFVSEEAAGGLWNLSVGAVHKAAITKTGAVKALVDIIFKWSSGTDGVLERAAGALANLAADDNCSMEIAKAGGVHALVMLVRSCKVEGVQEQAARALANLAAHGDGNINNVAVGKEAGALEALVQLTSSQNEGVRQEAAGALWNLSFDDRNREAIAAAGGVEALVALAQACINASYGLQERAAGALWGLSVSEANSIAIGREGGVAPLIALAYSDVQDVHETAVGALWNLAFNSENALIIYSKGGIAALALLCSSSRSKLARFMAALALAYMFDGRMEEFALAGSSVEALELFRFSSEYIRRGVTLDSSRRMALKCIDAFVMSFSDPQVFSTAAGSSAPAALVQIAEAARIQEAGHLRCSNSEIGRFTSMLRNPSSIIRACAAFALLQFTLPGGGHALHHVDLLKEAGAARILRATAAASNAPIELKIFARIVLRNLEHHRPEALH